MPRSSTLSILTDEKQQGRPSLTFLLVLQIIVGGLLAYLVLFTHSKYPEEPRLWVLLNISLAVCFLVLQQLG